MRADGIGLYVHLPICIRKCAYCDFCSVAEAEFSHRDKYFERLFSEIDSYQSKKVSVNTVFFGGGTPSLISERELSDLMRHIRNSFVISPDAEITIEANPKTLTREKLLSYKSYGINRISIGLQSIHQNELKILGRVHTFEDFLLSFNLARETGFDNLSVDLMYGIPEQTQESFRKTLDSVIALNPEHLSVYGLILEEGTPLYEKRKSLSFPNEDEEALMYEMASERLRSAGYSHYEISNYSKKGFQCKHNLKYWRAEEYIGVGVAAYSYYAGRRFGNTRNILEYISGEDIEAESATLTDGDMAYERVMLALRLSEGFSLLDYKEKYGVDFLALHKDKISTLKETGYVRLDEGRLSLTERGFYVSNSIISELI